MALNTFPTGLDWGDGNTKLPTQPAADTIPTPPPGVDTFGTPTPAEAVPQSTSGDGPEELPDSPEFERAEQATIKHTLIGTYEQMLTIITGLGRGTFLKDSFGNVTRVVSSLLRRIKPNYAELSYTAESISFDTPPDEWHVAPVDLGLDIIKNPRYSWALAPIDSDTNPYTTVGDIQVTFVDIKSSLIRMIQTYRDAPIFPSNDQINGIIQGNVMNSVQNGAIDTQVPIVGYDASKTLDPPPRWDGFVVNLPSGNYAWAIVSVPVDLSSPLDPVVIAIAAAKEIISKIWRQEDVPYLTGFEITWAQYFFKPQFLNPGGYIDNPAAVVPDFFYSPSQDGSDTIFDNLSELNPQDYSADGLEGGPVNISWLRKSDEEEYQRTWFKVQHKWVGSPIGTWDVDLYNGGNRPQNANDFDQLI